MLDSDIFHLNNPCIDENTRKYLAQFEGLSQSGEKPQRFNGQVCNTLFGKTYLLPESMVISKHLTWDDSIYHFMSINRLIKMIEDKKIYFQKVVNWEDPWEIPYRYLQLTKQEDNRDLINADNMYGVCWTKTFDTDAMWRIYSKNNKEKKCKKGDHFKECKECQECQEEDDRVCIATTIRQLFEALSFLRTTYSNLFMAPVQYVDLKSTTIKATPRN